MTSKSKRPRLVEPSPPNAIASELPPLTCVWVVCRQGPGVLRLPHVIANVHDFLDFSPHWTIVRACTANLPHLAQRLIKKDKLEPGNSSKRHPHFRTWQFIKAMSKAVTFDNLQLVQMLSTHFTGCRVGRHVVNRAAKLGRSEILHWLVANRGDTWWEDDAVVAAIEGNHFELAKWLHARTLRPVVSRWLFPAARTGNLELLKWVCSLSVGANPWAFIKAAVDSGSLEMVRWIAQHDAAEVEKIPIFLGSASSNNRVEMLQWLLTNHLDKCDACLADAEAAENGRLEIVQLLRSSNVRGCFQHSVCSAASGGHLEIIKWLQTNSPEEPGNAIDAAARGGYLEVVQWLHENSSEEGCTVAAMNNAAENGHLDVVKWLHEHCTEGCTVVAMNSAAERGRLDVVQWLSANRTEGCTNVAMDAAAKRGHIEVVKWLHANRTEGCTESAVDNAARNGHLEVVQWLHSNRTEGCTTRAMNKAAQYNHLNVVKWLHENRTEGCTTAAMDGAAEAGRLEVVRWLDANRLEGCTSRGLSAAVVRGHFDVAFFLHQARNNCDVATALRFCRIP